MCLHHLQLSRYYCSILAIEQYFVMLFQLLDGDKTYSELCSGRVKAYFHYSCHMMDRKLGNKVHA